MEISGLLLKSIQLLNQKEILLSLKIKIISHIYKILKITINLLSTSINILQLTPLDRTGKFLPQKILTVLTLLSGNLLTRSMLTTLVLLVPQSLSG